MSVYSLAFGIGTKNSAGEWLEVFYPAPLYRPADDVADPLCAAVGHAGGSLVMDLDRALIGTLSNANVDAGQQAVLETLATAEAPAVMVILGNDGPLTSTPETYLKLHLLSHRFVEPNEQDLTGIYETLPNVAWTSAGAIDLAELPARQLAARAAGETLFVHAIDKFPFMTNYVVPSGIRIANAGRVRLGAYVGEGTTVMHEGQINFNAAALGPNMVEGRISQGVSIGAGTDLGGSASTAGTLSGGGSIVISIGRDCLVSANAGTGIPLGDRCTIEAGLYITPGTLIQVLDEDRNFVKVVKARELAGQSDMLFIRNSQSGVVECRTNKAAIKLNETLHAHN